MYVYMCIKFYFSFYGRVLLWNPPCQLFWKIVEWSFPPKVKSCINRLRMSKESRVWSLTSHLTLPMLWRYMYMYVCLTFCKALAVYLPSPPPPSLSLSLSLSLYIYIYIHIYITSHGIFLQWILQKKKKHFHASFTCFIRYRMAGNFRGC